MKKIVSFLIIIMIVFILTGCNENKEQLVMVTEAGFAPYEFYENNEIVGVDVEIAKYIAKSMNKELVIKDVAFDSIINELQTNKADFAAAGFSITEERKKEVDFSIEYVTSKQVIVAKDKNITKNSLGKLKVAVQLGSVSDFYMQENFKSAVLVQQKKYLTMLEDLKNDKVDCIIMDELPAKELINEYSNIYINEELFTDTYGMAVKKGNKELLEEIDKCLEELLKENKITEYVIKYSE